MNCFFVPAALIGLLAIHRIQIETKTEEVEKLLKTNAFILDEFLCKHIPRTCAKTHTRTSRKIMHLHTQWVGVEFLEKNIHYR